MKYQYRRTIYYHDTDCGNVVYYANYLKFCEEARDEHFASLAIDLKKCNDDGVWFVVAHVEMDYKAPARFSDVLTVLSRVDDIRNASMGFSHEITRSDGGLLVVGSARIVCVGNDLKPVPIPEYIRAAFEQQVSKGAEYS
jgi:acyl-CoA thioester hydrolase